MPIKSSQNQSMPTITKLIPMSNNGDQSGNGQHLLTLLINHALITIGTKWFNVVLVGIDPH